MPRYEFKIVSPLGHGHHRRTSCWGQDEADARQYASDCLRPNESLGEVTWTDE